MEVNKDAEKFYQIFCPGYIEKVTSIMAKNKRFVYYTSAHVAFEIFNKKQLWFRNATVMNDYSEIDYGLKLCRKIFQSKTGDDFKSAVEKIIPGTIDIVRSFLEQWEDNWRYETYIACVSIHKRKEDESGRLSMWRAYGDTALVINNTPFVRATDKLGVYSMPVLYFSEEDLSRYFLRIIKSISENAEYLKALGQEYLVRCIHRMLLRFAITIKHPGFREEKEWRLFYRPEEQKSDAMEKLVIVHNGEAQKIYKLNLDHKPEIDLYHADIPTLLDRVIIGPTEYPYVNSEAFTEKLAETGVKNVHGKVVLSDIPYRID